MTSRMESSCVGSVRLQADGACRLKPAATCAVMIATCAVLAAAQRGAAGPTLFEGARIITGDSSTAIENGAMLVDRGTIIRVGRKGDFAAPAGAARVDLTGKTIMPGMVLAHGHIGYLRGTTFSRDNYTRDNILEQLNRYLYYGV